MLPAYAGDDCDVPDLLSYADSAAMTVVADLCPRPSATASTCRSK